MSRSFKHLAFINCFVAGAIFGYHEVNAGTEPSVMPDDEGISYIQSEDPGMGNAIDQARLTADQFIATLQAPQPNQADFALKVPIETDGPIEHVWLAPVRFENNQFIGIITNQTASPSDMKLGDEVAFLTRDISDWMYVEDGLLVGGLHSTLLA